MMQMGMGVQGSEKVYEKSGWMILSANALLGVVAGVLLSAPSLSMFSNPSFTSAYPIMGALGTALVGFNIFALVVILIPYRRHERWSWYTLWMLPLQWVSQFVFLPDLTYLMLALLTSVGLVLPYRRFFSGSQEESSRVS